MTAFWYFCLVTTWLVQATFASIAEPGTIWKSTRPTVCWADQKNWVNSTVLELGDSFLSAKQISPFSSVQKALIKAAIESNYTQNSVGMSFEGWSDCSITPKADIYLIHIDSPFQGGGMASIGQNGEPVCDEEYANCVYHKMATKKKAFVLLNTYPFPEHKVSEEEALQIQAIHEFGHAAGLRHEHARVEDARKDPACQEIGYDLGDSEDKSTTRYGPYDPSSMMSYCYLFKIVNKLGMPVGLKHLALSPIDQTTLRCLYGDKGKKR